MPDYSIRILETAEEMRKVEELQRKIWPGSETDVVPGHMLLPITHNGGLIVGAFEHERLIGFVFGFPGIELINGKSGLKHCSHMAGVIPDYRDKGLGFILKRAQWQIIRSQGIEKITWTYDPLFSRNAYLNIVKLGAVCNTYIRSYYGEMRDNLNAGLPSDRFRVDLWVNSSRISQRLNENKRTKLNLAHYKKADVKVIVPTMENHKISGSEIIDRIRVDEFEKIVDTGNYLPVLLVEIPADLITLKTEDLETALFWRLHTRMVFEKLFSKGYLVTDFIYVPGTPASSYYVLSHGEGKFT